MKESALLTQNDFDRFPVWVRVQDYDRDESWSQETTEQTYRPWNGPLPLEPISQFPPCWLRPPFDCPMAIRCRGIFNPLPNNGTHLFRREG